MQPEFKVWDLSCHHAILNVQRRKQKLNYFLHEMADLEFQKFAFSSFKSLNSKEYISIHMKISWSLLSFYLYIYTYIDIYILSPETKQQ